MELYYWPLFCYSFIILSLTAAAGSSDQWEPGAGESYRLETTLLLNEVDPKNGKDVGYQVHAAITVVCVWQNPNAHQDKLLKIEVQYPQLHIKSRQAPAPEGFVTHGSKLDSFKNSPILVHWRSGRVQNIFVDLEEDLSLINLKKAIASLFQYQLLDVEKEETDASGHCKASYITIDPHTFLKKKSNCKSRNDLPLIKHPEEAWGAFVFSKRKILFKLSKDLGRILMISSEESHEVRVGIREDVGSTITARLQLSNSNVPFKLKVNKAQSFDLAVKDLSNDMKVKFVEQPLITSRENLPCQDDFCPTFFKLVKENRDILHAKNLGTIKSASMFIKLINSVRNASKEEIQKVLKNSKNKNILPQLYDILGTAQTSNAHEIAMKAVNLNSQYDIENAERYFWALSFGSHPLDIVIRDLSLLAEKPLVSEKLTETVALTLAAVTNKFMRLPGNQEHSLVEEVERKILKKLKDCKAADEFCQLIYLRALKNLPSQSAIPQILELAMTGSRKVSVAALKALKAFPRKFWNVNVLKAAEKIYFQQTKLFDSSARTLSLDILLESNPSEEILKHLLLSVASGDPAFEVKQYLLQRLRQFSDNDSEFAFKLKTLLRSLGLNHYGALAQKGMTTAFTRSFMKHPSANGSLLTIQEVSGGLLKRGIVDVIINGKDKPHTIFSLGLFAAGLGSFVSSDDSISSPEENEESATAGMELAVMGVQIRPFVFFNGQGELMSHVWSGTGSEKTPAFQALGLLQDDLQFIPLGTGVTAELSLLGGVSFDLSGQVQFSLWNRNGHSLVEKNAGISLQGLVKVDSAFVRSQIEFQVGTEVKLNLVSDIDFYSKVSLCLQLKQLDSIIRHNIYKVERIPGSKHKLRKSTYKTVPVPGCTFALNQKNNDMCSYIFKET